MSGFWLGRETLVTWLPWIILAWCTWSCWRLATRSAQLATELRDQKYQLTRLKGALDETTEKLTILRAHTAAMAGGQKVPREQILKGLFYSEVGALEAFERTKSAPAPRLVDVRSPQEFMADHAVGAVLIPLDDLPNRLADLGSKDDALLLICASGGRSLQAAEYLAGLGYTNVASVRGGTASWPGPHEARSMVKLNYTPPVR